MPMGNLQLQLVLLLLQPADASLLGVLGLQLGVLVRKLQLQTADWSGLDASAAQTDNGLLQTAELLL